MKTRNTFSSPNLRTTLEVQESGRITFVLGAAVPLEVDG